MKKLLLVLIALFTFSGMALAAVNLNTASKDELTSVKGIGPAKAQAILDHRKKNGSFKSVDDLKNVKGFGDKSVDAVRAELSIGAAAPAQTDKKSDAKPETKAEVKADAKAAPAKAEPKKDDKAAKKDDKPAKK